MSDAETNKKRVVYNWILLSADNKFLIGSRAKEKPVFGDPDGAIDHWVEWGKELPEGCGEPAKDKNGKIKTKIVKIKGVDKDIEVEVYDEYIYEDGELVKQ